MTSGDRRRSYRPGGWFGIFGDNASVMLPPSEKRRVTALWEMVDEGAGFDEVLDGLLASGLRELPAFVLVSQAAGMTKVVLRGPAVAAFVVDGDMIELAGSTDTTWVERSLAGVTQMFVQVEATDEEDGEDLLIENGLVRLGRIDQPPFRLEETTDAAAEPVAVAGSEESDDETAAETAAEHVVDDSAALSAEEPDVVDDSAGLGAAALGAAGLGAAGLGAAGLGLGGAHDSALEEPGASETPAEDVSEADAPAEDVPDESPAVEVTSADEPSDAEVPADEAHTDGAPDGAPFEPVAAEEAPVETSGVAEEASSEVPGGEGWPVQASAEESDDESAPADEGAVEDGAAEDGAAEDGAAEDGAAEDGAVEDGAANETAAAEAAGDESPAAAAEPTPRAWGQQEAAEEPVEAAFEDGLPAPEALPGDLAAEVADEVPLDHAAGHSLDDTVVDYPLTGQSPPAPPGWEPLAAQVEEPAVEEPAVEEPHVDDVTGEPRVEDVTEEPHVEDVTEEPHVEDVTEEPRVEDVTEEPEVPDAPPSWGAPGNFAAPAGAYPPAEPAAEPAAQEPAAEEPAAEEPAAEPSDEPPGQPDEPVTPEAADHDGLTGGGWQPAAWQRPQPAAPAAVEEPPAAPTAPTTPAVAKLLFSSGETVEVDRPILVGRAPEVRRFATHDQPRLVPVPSPHQEISSTHLEVRPGLGADHGSAVVTDLGSTNGTVLVQPGLPPEDLQPGIAVQLVPGAIIDLGDGVTIQVTQP